MIKRFLLAPNDFKGTMTAGELSDIFEERIRAHIPSAEILRLPLSDGGAGFTRAYLSLLSGRAVPVTVTGVFGEPVETFFGLLSDGSAVMEMCACAGLPLTRGCKDPLSAATRGVGEMMKLAEAAGASRILMGLGGSATNDCGVGMAAALGYRFLDASGGPVEPLAKNLSKITRILPPETPFSIPVLAACDVDNPLLGPTGATSVFGPQKGVTAETASLLETGMAHFAGILSRDLHADVSALPGAGAAGGLGAGLVAFAHAFLTPGAELLFDAAHLDELLSRVDVVLTGEGRIDGQSVHGKAPVAIAKRAKEMGVPCIALCGSVSPGAEAAFACGVSAMFSSLHEIVDKQEAKARCRADMERLCDNVIRLLAAI